jgi:hypothetical protein
MVLCLTALWQGLNKMFEIIYLLGLGFMVSCGFWCINDLLKGGKND